MRRFVALAMIAALVSVSSLPLLPGPEVYAYAAERMVDCDSCHNEMPAMHSMSHAMNAKNVHQKMTVSVNMHLQRLSPAAQHCRIECCGHRDIDGLPHQLSPHQPALMSEMMLTFVMDVPVSLNERAILLQAAPPAPPPKLFFSKLS